MINYFPISLNSLKTETIIGCDIYILMNVKGSTRYVLYCKGDAVFGGGKKEQLIKKNVNRLFIRKNDEQKYYEYLETNFQDIISDKKIPSDEKAQIVHGTATNLVKDVFNDPRTGNIDRSKTFAYNMVDYILKDEKAVHSLLKIATHEYYTYTHSVNVAAVGTSFVKNLGLGEEDMKSFCTGILLHDLGKTKISPDILNKKGKLTEEEFEQIKKHPELGVEVLKETGNELKDVYTIVLQHHENLDGSGYPYGLKRNEIHPCGKIARIIDIYDALTTNRSYSGAMRPFAALTEMKEKMLNCFEKELFKEFICFLGPYDPRRKKRKKDILYT
ncbi:MAG: HD-GYP domain-containing protein [Candidatus Scalinduaceae bacterium]